MKRMIYWLMLASLLLALPVRANGSEWGIPVGGLHILKTTMTGDPLEGGVYQIARELREGELLDKEKEKQFLWIGGENRVMVMETFWTDRNMTGERQNNVKTDENGKAAIYGLAYGVYYLVEQEPPAGYNRMTEPVRVTIHKYSHLTAADNIRDDQNRIIDNTLHILTVRYALPETGGWGKLQLLAGGAGVVFSSAALILLNRKRW